MNFNQTFSGRGKEVTEVANGAVRVTSNDMLATEGAVRSCRSQIGVKEIELACYQLWRTTPLGLAPAGVTSLVEDSLGSKRNPSFLAGG